MKDDIEKILLSAFTGLESAHFFSAFNPSIFTISKFKAEPFTIRLGYLIASAFSLGLGAIVSKLIKDKSPFIASILISLGMVSVYEIALRL
jgi:hypothetical protein